MEKILDSVIFNDELDILRFRVDYLSRSQHIGEFHVFEGSHTFQGEKRKSFLQEACQELGLDALITLHYVKFPDDILKSGNPWKLETWLRKQQLSRLRGRGHPILFGDVDEIPSLVQIEEAAVILDERKAVSLPLAGAYVSAKIELEYAQKFPVLVLPTVNQEANVLRDMSATIRQQGKAPKGLHLSYWKFEADDFRAKFRSFSHSSMSLAERNTNEYFSYCEHFGLSIRGHTDKRHLGLLRLSDLSQCEIRQEIIRRGLEPPISTAWPHKVVRLAASENISRLLDGKNHFDLKTKHLRGGEIVVSLCRLLVRKTILLIRKIINEIQKLEAFNKQNSRARQ